VLYKGKPVAGAKCCRIGQRSRPEAVEDRKDGTVTIKVRNQGLNVITGRLRSPPEDPAKTKQVENLATLSFVLRTSQNETYPDPVEVQR
jgi:hypothetical protein